MLTKFANRVCTFFAVNYEPQFGIKLASVAEEIYAKSGPQKVNANIPSGYIFQWPADRQLMVVDFQHVAWQTLGLSPWQDNLKDHAAVIRGALRTIGIEKSKRIGFKVQAFLPLDMSHLELSQLMFGSFLAPAEELAEVFGEPNDPLVQLQGNKNGMEYTLQLCGMTSEQISQHFLRTINLEYLIQQRFLDTGIKDFHDRIVEKDCFYFDLDLFQRDVAIGVLDEFLKNSLAECEEIADACVHRLQSQPVKGGR